ncbi:hypothetical protein LguiA_010631 [Lonicera macranthoides]
MATLHCPNHYTQHQNPIKSQAKHSIETIIRCKETGDLWVDNKKQSSIKKEEKKKLRILIAGGGIGGLVLALAAKKREGLFSVEVFERDLSSVRGEGRHRGPIQLLSSAMEVVEAIDEEVLRRVVEEGCVTGDRINGLADGISGEWFAKFDLLSPAVKRGLPVTQVICRMALQDILLNALGPNIVTNNSKVVDFVQDSQKVTVILEDGQRHEGDILVGADGIWSEVRSKLFGKQDAKYSNYTCYSGLTNFVPPYIDYIGYRVFLGLNQYFVASDVGKGKMQWYAFHKESPFNPDDPLTGKKEKLIGLFGSWCRDVVTLISKTQEDMILQRDIYDRDMIYSWGIGRVTLLGDAAHPMQPNLGQGGCMAIEDCYQLILELDKVAKSGHDFSTSNEITSALKRYEKKRMIRVSTVHTVSRMASKMLSSYQPYIAFGPITLFHLPRIKILHPAIHIARAILHFCLPKFMTWLLTGPGLGQKKEEDQNSSYNLVLKRTKRTS